MDCQRTMRMRFAGKTPEVMEIASLAATFCTNTMERVPQTGSGALMSRLTAFTGHLFIFGHPLGSCYDRPWIDDMNMCQENMFRTNRRPELTAVTEIKESLIC
jgi:hypothetical protein